MSTERDYTAITRQYALSAWRDTKQKKHCKWVRLAAKRFLDDWKKQNTKAFPYYWDGEKAALACEFIEMLPHVQGTWDTENILLEPWQIFGIANLFGWRRVSDGGRRFSAYYEEVARKNAKSTKAAGIALYTLIGEKEVGPEIVIGATTGAQAQKVFKPAQQMVKRRERLRMELELEPLARSIFCNFNNGSIQPINAKASTQDGWNPHCGILDELHAHPNRALYDVIKSAFGARKNPLLYMITTAGYDTSGVCYEQREFVTKVLQGVVEADHYFGIIYTLDKAEDKCDDPEEIKRKKIKDDDPLDERNWIKANPNLYKSVSIEQMRSYAIEAKNSPDSMGEFLTKRCNVWTTAKAAKFNIVLYQRCAGELVLEDFEGLDVWGGLDLGAVSDMNALALAARHRGRTQLWCRFWLPEETVTSEYVKRRNVPYKRWVDQGLLRITPGNVTDYEVIEKDVLEIFNQVGLMALAYDPWNAIDMANRLRNHGLPMVEFRQGIPSFAPGMKEAERIITDGTLLHSGCPILQWHFSNVVARKDANENEAPDKANSMEKIDGAVASLMGLAMMKTQEDSNPTSVYETADFIV